MTNLFGKHARFFYGIAGIGILALSFYLVGDKLGNIMAAEPDVFYGPLFGIAAFLLTKTLEKDILEVTEEETLDAIRDGQSEKIEKQIKREISRRLTKDSYFEELASLERNVNATIDRLGEYYSARTTDDLFHESLPLLNVITDDLDHTYRGVNSLRASINRVIGNPADDADILRVNKKDDVVLYAIARDIREAINRRNEAFGMMNTDDLFRTQFNSEHKEAFKIISSDLFKAHKILSEIIGASRRNGILREELVSVNKYLNASIARALALSNRESSKGELLSNSPKLIELAIKAGFAIETNTTFSKSAQFKLPMPFGVMLSDCARASTAINDLITMEE